MGILPIGFFSPLPLAMMIPFMATQSLAMGEAFGKSFQYGKRKISSMSNEDFNKLTFHDLMVEQTANIKAIVPELSKQMSQSQTMQAAIFKEMVNLIPTFFDSLFSALDPKHIENPTLTSQAAPPPPITEIRYFNDRSEFQTNQDAIDATNKLLQELLKQQGTKESLAEKLNPTITPPPTPAPKPNLFELEKGKQLNEDQQWRDWSSKLSKLQQELQQLVSQYTIVSNTSSKNSAQQQQRLSRLSTNKNQQRAIQSKIRMMSNDYRNANNNIRENAVRLRQLIAKGRWY